MSMHYKALPAGQQSLFDAPVYDPKFPGRYGMFGYASAMTHEAIAQQDEDKLREAVQRGWVTPESRTFCGDKLPDWCEERGKPKSAASRRARKFFGAWASNG